MRSPPSRSRRRVWPHSSARLRSPPRTIQKDEEGKEKPLNEVWSIDGLRTGFCIQLLIDPNTLDVPFSREARPLRADAVPDLSPALKSVLQEQPQYASWSPSQLCLYYMETVDVGSLRVSERSPDKVPLLGIWSLAATDVNGGARRDVVLRLFTNTGRLERAGQVNGLDLRKIRGKVEEIENEDDPTAPPHRNSIRASDGKDDAHLGRPASDRQHPGLGHRDVRVAGGQPPARTR